MAAERGAAEGLNLGGATTDEARAGHVLRGRALVPTAARPVAADRGRWSLYYYWKWSKGVEHVSGGASGGLTFILWLLLSPVAMIYAQVQFNKVGGSVTPLPATA